VGFGGGGQGFPAGNLYVVDFAGEVIELSNVRSAQVPAGAPAARVRRPTRPRLVISVRPRRARVGTRTRFRIRVRARGRAVARVRVRFARRAKRTNVRGLARFTVRLRHSGRYRVRASRRGYRSAVKSVRVLRR
jgi:hypothetical protein